VGRTDSREDQSCEVNETSEAGRFLFGNELDCSTGSAGHGCFGDRRKDSRSRRGSWLVRFTARWSVKLGVKATQIALQDAGG